MRILLQIRIVQDSFWMRKQGAFSFLQLTILSNEMTIHRTKLETL